MTRIIQCKEISSSAFSNIRAVTDRLSDLGLGFETIIDPSLPPVSFFLQLLYGMELCLVLSQWRIWLNSTFVTGNTQKFHFVGKTVPWIDPFSEMSLRKALKRRCLTSSDFVSSSVRSLQWLDIRNVPRYTIFAGLLARKSNVSYNLGFCSGTRG